MKRAASVPGKLLGAANMNQAYGVARNEYIGRGGFTILYKFYTRFLQSEVSLRAAGALSSFMLARVLQAHDDEDLRLSVWDRLRQGGYSVETAADGLEGLTKAIAGGFHLLILDATLPRVSGLDVCRALRRAGYNIPILLLTDCNQSNGKIAGLRIGADDCLTKPVDVEEVFLRVQALLRRSTVAVDPGGSSYGFGSIHVEFRRTEVFRDGTLLDLSAKEFHLLQYFIANRGETLSRQTLLRDVWAYRSTPSTRTVDVHVSWLRQKLEDDPKLPRWIITVHGMGYKFLG